MPVVLLGPAPQASPRGGFPHPLGFCAICAAAWKAEAFATQRPEVERADRAKDTTTIPLKAPGLPALAVAWGLAALPVPTGQPGAGSPALTPLPLCWTHLQAVSFLSGGIVPAPPGAVLLDGHPPRT